MAFERVAGDPDSGTILHVPHSSRVIPPDVRIGILLSDDDLMHQLDLMTDAHTDVIAEQAASAATSRPWLFINRISRLVVDPERFLDESEPMRSVGMGAVYTRTASGESLREDNTTTTHAYLESWFHPYAAAVTDLVDERLAAADRVTIIDVHSYPSQRLPYELGGQERPAICIGTDDYHTPPWLLDAARECFTECGDVAVNTPFAGCYVPLKHLATAERVSALMIEIRRDIYMTEPGGPPLDGIASVSRGLGALIDAVARSQS